MSSSFLDLSMSAICSSWVGVRLCLWLKAVYLSKLVNNRVHVRCPVRSIAAVRTGIARGAVVVSHTQGRRWRFEHRQRGHHRLAERVDVIATLEHGCYSPFAQLIGQRTHDMC